MAWLSVSSIFCVVTAGNTVKEELINISVRALCVSASGDEGGCSVKRKYGG